MEKITEREIIDNNSDIDSMRWGFVRLVRLGIVLAVLTVGMIITSPWIPIAKEAKAWDIGSMLTLTGIVFSAAFGGHIGQSFSPDARPTNPGQPVSPIVPKPTEGDQRRQLE